MLLCVSLSVITNIFQFSAANRILLKLHTPIYFMPQTATLIF